MSDLHERLARLRAEQASRPPFTMEEVATALAARFAPHMDHPWEKVGRCVFCVPCGERLYQGTIPEGHPVGQRQSKPPRNLLAEFRDRWGNLA